MLQVPDLFDTLLKPLAIRNSFLEQKQIPGICHGGMNTLGVSH